MADSIDNKAHVVGELCGVKLSPVDGESSARFERKLEIARRAYEDAVMADSSDPSGAAAGALMELTEKLLLAEDENRRLRTELTDRRERLAAAERKCDLLRREAAALRKKAEREGDRLKSVEVRRVYEYDLRMELTEYASACPWEAGKHLAKLLTDGTFTGWQCAFAALTDGRIVGFCTFMEQDYYPENRYTPWISSIFVDEKYRRRGICGRMIEYACGYARAQGFGRVFIPSHETGIYERYGFTRIDELVNYAGDTDFVFEKIIG